MKRYCCLSSYFLMLILVTEALGQALPGGTLDPTLVPKYVSPLVIPPVMPRTAKIKPPKGMGQQNKQIDYYEIAVRQFQQQILPPGLPVTTVWSYGSVNHPGTFNYPAFTIEAKSNTPVRVKWINDLKDAAGNYLPHLLAVDPTLHWANPPGGEMYRDMRPMFMETPGPYAGPVPLVTHVHGAHTTQESDGYPEAWYLPNAVDIPAGYATTGTFYDYYKTTSPLGAQWGPGFTVFEYPNDQRATTLWYHDHALGMTRLNVYAGPAGFYLIRGGAGDAITGVLPGPAPAAGDLPGTKYYEIPLGIQDRSFNADGSLYYPDNRAFFDGYAGPFVPNSSVSPIWNPEFFGNTMVVNGKTWPVLDVEPRRYRFRFLNGCNSRFLILQTDAGLPFWQIGAEGGFLAAPAQLPQLLLGPAERADVILDFTGLSAGTQILLQNLGPDEPFGGGVPGVDFAPADPATTGQVMLFRVGPPASVDNSTPPGQLVLPVVVPLTTVSPARDVVLHEHIHSEADVPVAALLGTLQDGPLMWMDPITEQPAVGATEIWNITNMTADAHPIHLHLVNFQVVDRTPFDTAMFDDAYTAWQDGGKVGPPPHPLNYALTAAVLPQAGETGWKDTVIAYPGEVTRIIAKFDMAGLYVWHCHIVEHEDNEMMRPYHVGPIPMALDMLLNRHSGHMMQ